MGFAFVVGGRRRRGEDGAEGLRERGMMRAGLLDASFEQVGGLEEDGGGKAGEGAGKEVGSRSGF